MLNADFNCLACLLALVEESAAHLKLIYGSVHDSYLPSFSSSSGFSESSASSRNISFSISNNNDSIDLNLNLNIDIPKTSNEIESNNNIDLNDDDNDKDKDNIANIINNSNDLDGNNPRNNVWKKVESSKNLNMEKTHSNKTVKNDDNKIMYSSTRYALLDCLNHISKSFDLFLKHINTNNKLLNEKEQCDLNNNGNCNLESDLKYLTKTSNNIFPFSPVFSTSFLQISDLTNAYSKAENQISKIVKSQNDFKVSYGLSSC